MRGGLTLSAGGDTIFNKRPAAQRFIALTALIVLARAATGLLRSGRHRG